MTTPNVDPTFAALINLITKNARPNRIPSPPSDTKMAEYVLANSSIKFGKDNPLMPRKENKPSILSRIVDVISRPNYAVANYFHSAAQGKNPLEGFARGLAGKDKTTFSTVLGEDLGIENKAVKGLGGFILDVGLDPTTYIGGSALKGLGKGASKGIPKKPIVSLTESAAKIPDELPPPVFKANPEQHELVTQTLDVMPSAVQKYKPIPQLGGYEKLTVEHVIKELPKTKAKINLKDPTAINPAQQLAIWHSLRKESDEIVGTPSEQFNKTYHMMIEAENALEASGKSLRYWDGSNLKLTDVISEMVHGKGVSFDKKTFPVIEKELKKSGNVRFKDPDVTQAIHNVRVRSALLDSPKIREAVDAVLEEKRALGEAPVSDARIKDMFKRMPILAKRHAADSGASEAGSDAAKDLAKSVLDDSITDPQKAIQSKATVIQEGMATGKLSAPEINAPLTSSLKKNLDISAEDFRQPMSDSGGVTSSIMGRIFSWYGQKDLRPLTEQHLLTATSSARLRSDALRRFAEPFSRDQQLQAVRFAQGLDGNPSQLGNVFRSTLENLFKGSGLSEQVWKSNTVASRAGLIMERLNRHLRMVKASWQFGSKKVTHPVTGEMLDFSEGTDWLKSWQAWDIKDPIDFFTKINSAVENTVHEKAIFDDLAERFGSPVAGNSYTNSINHPYLNNYFFTKDIADQVPMVIRDIDNFFDAGARSPFLQTFDKINRAWKFSVTLPNPSHHIRNLIGDTYLSWMAGVNSITPYKQAMQVLRTQRHLYQGINDVDTLVQIGAIDRAMGKTPDAKSILVKNKSGQGFTSEQIFVAANNMGILPQAHVLEDIMGGDQALTRFKPFGGKVKGGLEKTSEIREHFVRLAHFIDIVKKSSGKNYQEIFEKAGYTVRKWHPDYLTLTPFEKKFLRRIMPFYSWTRRAIPLVIESAVKNPGKTSVYPKAIQGLQETMGVEGVDRGNPFPGDQAFPQWIRDMGVGPIFNQPELGARGVPGVTGEQEGYTIVNPSNPFLDIGSQFSNPVKGVAEMLTPAFKIPAELATGRQVLSGAPINSDNFWEYLGNQLPIFSTVQGATGVTPALGQTTRAQREGNINIERIVNWLTALGVRGTGPYVRQANIEQGRR